MKQYNMYVVKFQDTHIKASHHVQTTIGKFSIPIVGIPAVQLSSYSTSILGNRAESIS